MFNNIQAEFYSNYFFSPVNLVTNIVAKGKLIIDEKFLFKKYSEYLKKYSFFLDILSLSKNFRVIKGTNSNSKDFLNIINSQGYHFNQQPRLEFPRLQINFLPECELVDNANNIIACGLQIHKKTEGNNPITYSGGKIIFLPPPSNLTIEEGIDLLLEDLGVTQLEELFPDWVNSIQINGLDEIDKKLVHLDEEKNKIVKSIEETIKEKKNVEKYYNLLTSQGTTLENIVCDVFKELGFTDINNDRGKEFKNWRFEFLSDKNDKPVIGVIEVFGTEGCTSERKLNQCQKWVDDYELGENRDAKGLFVVNQYRQKPYPDSKIERLTFEPSHIKFAERRNICIIPTITLFDLINRKFGGENIEKNVLEEKILKSKGQVESF